MNIYRVQLLEFNGWSIACINLEVGPVVVVWVYTLCFGLVMCLYFSKRTTFLKKWDTDTPSHPPAAVRCACRDEARLERRRLQQIARRQQMEIGKA